MKKWVHRIVVLTILTILFAAGKVSAQDAGMSDAEISDGREPAEADKAIFSPGESEVRYVPKASGVATAKDSASLENFNRVTQRAPGKADQADQKEEKPKENSILTFNFLYYIIQKYKLQDIID